MRESDELATKNETSASLFGEAEGKGAEGLMQHALVAGFQAPRPSFSQRHRAVATAATRVCIVVLGAARRDVDSAPVVFGVTSVIVGGHRR